ncbi:MAG: hypothetical protein ACREXG_02515 [Polaromonas sp.]
MATAHTTAGKAEVLRTDDGRFTLRLPADLFTAEDLRRLIGAISRALAAK